MRLLAIGLGSALLAAFASVSQAFPIHVSISSVDASGVETTRSAAFEARDRNGDGVFEYDLSDLPAELAATDRWILSGFGGSLNPDPVISNSFSVQNLSANTQTFIFTIVLPTGPIGNPTTLTGGSAQAGLTDADGDGATLSAPSGGAFYTAFLDNVDFVSLYLDPSSVSVGPFLSGNLTPVEDFGTPIPGFPGPAVTNSIGFRFEFDLTPNDRASGSGVFVVEPVPEPTTALLLGAGLVGLAARKRAGRAATWATRNSKPGPAG